jgi:hypothetical protein
LCDAALLRSKKRAQKSVMEFPAMKFNLLREAERINANGRLG